MLDEQNQSELDNVIKEHILKTRKKPEYCIPYVALISNFIEYFEVDVEEEVVEPVKEHNEITAVTLNKIGASRRYMMTTGYAKQMEMTLISSKIKKVMKQEQVLMLLLKEDLILLNMHICLAFLQ